MSPLKKNTTKTFLMLMVDHLELKRKGEYICICLIHSIRIDANNRLECEIFLNQENLDSSPLRYKQNRVRTHTTHDQNAFCL